MFIHQLLWPRSVQGPSDDSGADRGKCHRHPHQTDNVPAIAIFVQSAQGLFSTGTVLIAAFVWTLMLFLTIIHTTVLVTDMKSSIVHPMLLWGGETATIQARRFQRHTCPNLGRSIVRKSAAAPTIQIKIVSDGSTKTSCRTSSNCDQLQVMTPCWSHLGNCTMQWLGRVNSSTRSD